MFRESRKVLSKGLSPSMRILLGTISGLFGVAMLLIAPTFGASAGIYAFAVFCLLISLACLLTGLPGKIVGRLIGLAIFGICLSYLISQIQAGPLYSGKRSEPSVLNAAILMMIAGVPALVFAILGRLHLRKSENQSPES